MQNVDVITVLFFVFLFILLFGIILFIQDKFCLQIYKLKCQFQKYITSFISFLTKLTIHITQASWDFISNSLKKSPRFFCQLITILFIWICFLEISLWGGHFIAKSYRYVINHKKTLEKDIKILAIGESTTALGPPGINSWPKELEKLLNTDSEFAPHITVFNEGIPSVDSLYFAEQLPFFIHKYQPDLIISMLGINNSARIFLNPKWYYQIKIVKLYFWLNDFLNNDKIEVDIHLRKKIWQDFRSFLQRHTNHSLRSIRSFCEKEKKKVSPNEHWLIDDVIVEILTQISQSGPPRNNYEYLKIGTQIPLQNYQILSLPFFENLLKQKSVGQRAGEALFLLTPPTNLDPRAKAFRQFLFKHYNRISEPRAKAAVLRAISLNPELYSKVRSAYSFSTTIGQSYQANYHQIVEIANSANIPIFLVQYPQLPLQWLKSIFENEITGTKEGWFCDDWVIGKKLASHFKNLNFVSNENIREQCLLTNSKCYADTFHLCPSHPEYSFGHAASAKVNQLIAQNIYREIKKKGLGKKKNIRTSK